MFTTKTIPKWIGSMPLAIAIGARIGAKTRVALTESINAPRTMSAELLTSAAIAAALVGAGAAWVLRTGGYRTEADTPRQNPLLWWWLVPTLMLAWVGIAATAADPRLLTGDLV